MQPAESQKYLVNEIYATLQGEGAHAGAPVVLLRLHGCDVQCNFCDTKHTWLALAKHLVSSIEEANANKASFCQMTGVQIAEYIKKRFAQIDAVLVTGGEPAQQDLCQLTSALRAYGFKTWLETSGTALGHILAGFDWCCVSPKIDNPGGLPVLKSALLDADEVKFVIGKEADLMTAKHFVSKHVFKRGCLFSLQPMSTSMNATKLCIQFAMKNNWHVSIQIHKYIGIE